MKLTDEEVKKHETVSQDAAVMAGVSEDLLRTRFVYDPKYDCYNRVRRHQVKEQHTHFWDDRRQRWIDLKTLQPE